MIVVVLRAGIGPFCNPLLCAIFLPLSVPEKSSRIQCEQWGMMCTHISKHKWETKPPQIFTERSLGILDSLLDSLRCFRLKIFLCLKSFVFEKLLKFKSLSNGTKTSFETVYFNDSTVKEFHRRTLRETKYFSSWRKAELLFLLSTTIALNREKCSAHTTREKKCFHCLHNFEGVKQEKYFLRESERTRETTRGNQGDLEIS